MLDKGLIKAFDQMTEAKHTGALEVYHSLLLKYCEKRNHFSKEGMFIRTALAALDNNNNIGRFQARTNSGDLRYKVVYPKGRKDWVAKPITETKSYDYLTPMVRKVIEARLSDPSAPPVVQPPLRLYHDLQSMTLLLSTSHVSFDIIKYVYYTLQLVNK